LDAVQKFRFRSLKSHQWPANEVRQQLHNNLSCTTTLLWLWHSPASSTHSLLICICCQEYSWRALVHAPRDRWYASAIKQTIVLCDLC